MPLRQEFRATRLHLQRTEVQLLGGIGHRLGAFGDNDFVVEAVFPQQLFMEDLVAVLHQPLTQRLLTAIGLQDQAFPAIEVRLAAVENVADRLATHAAQADSGNVIARFNRRQTIGQAHGDVLRQAIVGHGTVGRLKRRSGHFPRHGRRNSATAHQRHRQVGVV